MKNYFHYKFFKITTISIIMKNKLINAGNAEHYNALLLSAAERGEVETVMGLIIMGVDVNTQDEVGLTPLMRAAVNGDISLARILLSAYGVNLNAQDKDGLTALMYAINSNNFALAKEILAMPGIDFNVQDKGGNTALIYAASAGCKDAVVEILAVASMAVNSQNKNGNTALIFAAARGHKAVVKELLNAGISVNIQNKDGNTALIYAVANGHAELVSELLAVPGIAVNIEGKYRRTALMVALINRRHDIAIQLLELDSIDVNVQDAYGLTALMYAAKNGDINSVRSLIVWHEAKVNLQDSAGNTALTYAAGSGDSSVVTELLNVKGILFNVQARNGITAFMVAVDAGHVAVVKRFMELDGINLNTQDLCGNTALMMAADKNYIDIVKLLVDRLSADEVCLLNNKGQSACSVAKTGVAKYLIYSGKGLGDDKPQGAANNIHQMASDMLMYNAPGGCYDFLVNVYNTISLLATADDLEVSFSRRMGLLTSGICGGPLPAGVLGGIFQAFPYRISFLAARVCGVRFPNNITVRHTGMSMEKLKVVSSIMRSAALAKVRGIGNLYLFIRTLFLQMNEGSIFEDMSFDLKNNIAGFLGVGDLGCIAPLLAAMQKPVLNSGDSKSEAEPSANDCAADLTKAVGGHQLYC